MSDYLFRKDGGSPTSPDFKLDATQRENGKRVVQWPTYPIEDGAVITNYGWRGEREFSIGGMLSAIGAPEVGATNDPSRVTKALEALDKMADGLTLFTLVQRFRTVDVVIKEIADSRTDKSGDSVDVSISCQTVTRAKSQVVSISPNRLRPRVRRKSGARRAQGPYSTKGCNSIDECARQDARDRSQRRLIEMSRGSYDSAGNWSGAIQRYQSGQATAD